jgi:hypothetical protein
MPNPTCTIPGCDKPSRNRSGTAPCPMHYHRQYRHGSTDVTAHGVSTSDGRRYRRTYRPGHPLARSDGSVYVHRAVLYDAIGPGPHPCHHCGTPVDWHTSDRRTRLEADHLNHQGDDNRPENLAPACSPCNARRATTRRHRALVAAGWWSEHDTVAQLHDRALLD